MATNSYFRNYDNFNEQNLIDDSPWIPLWYQGERYVLLKPYIKDYFLTPMVIPKLRYVYIDKTE